MGVEQTNVPGLLCDDFDPTCNRNESSTLAEIGANVALIRKIPAGKTYTEEASRRDSAIGIHKKLFPEYILPQQLLILQGYSSYSQETKSHNGPFPALARVTPRMEDVTPISRIKTAEIFQDADICEAMMRINFRGLKLMFTSRKILDTGARKGDRDNEGNIVNMLVRSLKNSNLFTSVDDKGKKQIFMDPDMYFDFNIKNLPKGIMHGTRFAVLSVIYGATNAVHKIKQRRTRVRSRSGYEIQEKRKFKQV